MFLPVFVCLFVCLSVSPRNNSKSYGRIFLKFCGYVGHGINYQWFNFGRDPTGILDSGSLWNFCYRCVKGGIREPLAKRRWWRHLVEVPAGYDCYLVATVLPCVVELVVKSLLWYLISQSKRIFIMSCIAASSWIKTKHAVGTVKVKKQGVPKCPNLFLSELCQISTKFHNFWHTDS